jgi:hypothetical protein
VLIASRRLPTLLLAGLTAGCVAPNHAPPAHPAIAADTVKDNSSQPVAKVKATPHEAKTAAASQIDKLIGMDEARVRFILGKPASQEDHPPTKRWVYRARKCTLDVTFFPDVETRRFQALNYEVSDDNGSLKHQQQCVAEFSSRFPTTAAK